MGNVEYLRHEIEPGSFANVMVNSAALCDVALLLCSAVYFVTSIFFPRLRNRFERRKRRLRAAKRLVRALLRHEKGRDAALSSTLPSSRALQASLSNAADEEAALVHAAGVLNTNNSASLQPVTSRARLRLTDDDDDDDDDNDDGDEKQEQTEAARKNDKFIVGINEIGIESQSSSLHVSHGAHSAPSSALFSRNFLKTVKEELNVVRNLRRNVAKYGGQAFGAVRAFFRGIKQTFAYDSTFFYPLRLWLAAVLSVWITLLILYEADKVYSTLQYHTLPNMLKPVLKLSKNAVQIIEDIIFAGRIAVPSISLLLMLVNWALIFRSFKRSVLRLRRGARRTGEQRLCSQKASHGFIPQTLVHSLFFIVLLTIFLLVIFGLGVAVYLKPAWRKLFLYYVTGGFAYWALKKGALLLLNKKLWSRWGGLRLNNIRLFSIRDIEIYTELLTTPLSVSKRLLYGAFSALFSFFRLDRSVFFATLLLRFDGANVSYLGTLCADYVNSNNPILLLAIAHMKEGIHAERRKTKREVVRNRFWLYAVLVRNPHLIQYRRRPEPLL